jgi:hypothetical protein
LENGQRKENKHPEREKEDAGSTVLRRKGTVMHLRLFGTNSLKEGTV